MIVLIHFISLFTTELFLLLASLWNCSYALFLLLLILLVSTASLLRPETSGGLDYVSKKKTEVVNAKGNKEM